LSRTSTESPGDDGVTGERDTIKTDVENLVSGSAGDVLAGNISNLSHLLSTVSGSVTSPGDYIAGCFVRVASPSGGGFDAGSYITPGGSFAFSSPGGPKQGLVLKANGSTSCPFHLHLGVFLVSNEMKPLKDVLPELATVKVVVKNDLEQSSQE